jgi:hypothetical protein
VADSKTATLVPETLQLSRVVLVLRVKSSGGSSPRGMIESRNAVAVPISMGHFISIFEAIHKRI